MIKLTQKEMENKIIALEHILDNAASLAYVRELEARIARLEALNNIGYKPVQPKQYKHIDVIPVVDYGSDTDRR